MQRIIKFRAKRIDNDKWVYGYLTTMFNSLGIIDKDDENSFYQVKPETIGQFTGIYSDTNEELYEKDVIQVPDNYEDYGIFAGEIYEVYFNYGSFRLKPKLNLKSKGFILENDKTFKLLGNIIDNPNLLNN